MQRMCTAGVGITSITVPEEMDAASAVRTHICMHWGFQQRVHHILNVCVVATAAVLHQAGGLTVQFYCTRPQDAPHLPVVSFSSMHNVKS